MLSSIQSQQQINSSKRHAQGSTSSSLIMAKIQAYNNSNVNDKNIDQKQNIRNTLETLDLSIGTNKQMKQSGSRRYQNSQPDMQKFTLPILSYKKNEQDEKTIKNSQLQMNHNNNIRLPPRLPKLDPKSIPIRLNKDESPIKDTNNYQGIAQRKKHSSYDPFLNQIVDDNLVSPQKGRESKTNSSLFEVLSEEREENKTQNKQKKSERIHQIVQVYGSKTKPGCQANKAPKTNQDSMILGTKNLENLGYHFFGVCDGHGVNGHLVSGYIKNALPKHLNKHLKDQQSNDSIETKIIKAFAQTNKEIWNSDVDTNLSGSTTVSILIKQDKILSANVGDSRAIMARHTNDSWKVIELTHDHKPNDENEKKRILDFGGRIEAQKDYHGNQIGPERVWLSYIDAPGLAMTRSMGDKVGAEAGVTADPEIMEFTITDEDKFIIVASDGVWEYLTNEDVMNIVLPYYERQNPDLACERLIAESTAAWRKQSFARDDITCIVIFLSK